MNSHPQPRNSTLAFTLIELLVVITIIAILMGLLFPAINLVKEQARKAEAKAAVTQIAAAVKQYYNEYGKYPVGDAIVPDNTDLAYGESGNGNEKLFDILRNIKTGGGSGVNEYNPRAIIFFEAKAASNPEAPRSGFVNDAANSNAKGSFVDPWGKQYVVVIDTDYDNQIKEKLPHTDFKGNDRGPRTGVAVYSLGKDGDIGSPKDGINGKFRDGSKISDDVISWQ